MKMKLLGLIALTLIKNAIAADVLSVTVPFTYIGLRDGQVLQAGYQFKPNTVIYCREANIIGGLFSIKWHYKGESLATKLPMRLKNKEEYPGQMADDNGVITIQNHSGQDRTFISCTFEKKKI